MCPNRRGGVNRAHDAPLVERDDAVRERHDLVEVLGDQQDRHPLGARRQQRVAHLLAGPDVDAARGLAAISTRGWHCSSRPISSRWALPPESWPTGRRTSRWVRLTLATTSPAMSFAVPGDAHALADRLVAIGLEDHVAPDRLRGDEADLHPVLGHVADAAVDEVARRAAGEVPAPDLDAAGDDRAADR